jgi:hypothetical protein
VMLVFVHGQTKAIKSYLFSCTRKAVRSQAPLSVYPFSSMAVVQVYIPINGTDPSGRAV